jgi:hypothetical protein
LDQVLAHTWDSSGGSEGLTFTKEVFSPLRLPFYDAHFDTMVLHRRAEFTFPSASGADAYLFLFDSLMANNLTAAIDGDDRHSASMSMNRTGAERTARWVVERIKTHIYNEVPQIDFQQKQCVAHLLGFYIILSDAARLKVPVIDYTELLLRSGDSLLQYLREVLPAPLVTETLVRDLTVLRNLPINSPTVFDLKVHPSVQPDDLGCEEGTCSSGVGRKEGEGCRGSAQDGVEEGAEEGAGGVKSSLLFTFEVELNNEAGGTQTMEVQVNAGDTPTRLAQAICTGIGMGQACNSNDAPVQRLVPHVMTALGNL